MTRWTNIEKVYVLFKNREGIDQALEINEFGEGAYAEIEVTDDGLNADFMLYSPDMNNGTGYGFRTLDDHNLQMVRRDAKPYKAPPKELGTVGKAILTVVTLAILAPFVGLLWHWAIGVMQL